jgi:PAS domain S-box-containing protein
MTPEGANGGRTAGDEGLRSAIVQALGDGFFRTDPAGTIVEVNDAFCSLVGVDGDGLLGAPPPYAWWPDGSDGRPTFTDRLDAVLGSIDGRLGFEETLPERDGAVRTVVAHLTVWRSSIGTVGGVIGTITDVTTERGAAGRLDRLAERLAPIVAEDEALDAIVDGVMEAVPLTGAGLLMPVADGTALVPRRHRGMGWRDDEPPLPLTSELPLTRAFTDGTASFFADRDEMVAAFPATEPLLNRRDDHARASLPLRGRHGTTAVLHLLFPTSSPFPDDERRFLRAVADRCGLVLERAALYEEQRREIDRASRLQDALGALGAATRPDTVADVVLRQAVPALGGRAGSISLLDDGAHELRLVSAWGFEGGTSHGWDTLALDLPLPGTDAVRDGRPVYLGDRAAIAGAYPSQTSVSEDAGDHAWAALPLVAGVAPIGLLFVNFPLPQRFDARQRLGLESIADRAAHAIERARVTARDHDVASALQHDLLPRDLVDAPTVRVATRYEAGGEGLEVGGDWYDAIGLPDGRIALTVGDVVGRGLGAATTMGHLRSALRALALLGGGPGPVLDGLDRFAASERASSMATVAYAELDPGAGTLRYAVAGHHPPILVRATGAVEVLGGGRSPLLDAIVGLEPRDSAVVSIEPGDTLVLYTDGLTERRREAPDAGLARLVGVLEGAERSSPDELCDLLLARVPDAGERDDDVAILCARLRAVHHLATIAAVPESLGGLRRTVDGWLAEAGVAGPDREDLVVAVNEAAANSIEHAYRGRRAGDVTVEADLDDGLAISVIDHGTWRFGEGDPERGRGMYIMRSLVDDLEVVRRPDGTTVVLRRALPVLGGVR